MQFDLAQILDQLLSSGVTACFTVLGGVIVLVLGQVAVKFFIEPLQEYSKLLGEIAHSLTYYANVYSGAGGLSKERVDEASGTLRRQASQLRAAAWTIRWYWLWRVLGMVPRKRDMIEASVNLIGLSNSMVRADPTDKREQKVKQLLRLQ